MKNNVSIITLDPQAYRSDWMRAERFGLGA